MKNNQFLQLSCLALMAVLHGVSLNQSTIVEANKQNSSTSTLLSSILKNVKDTHPDLEITPIVDDFTYSLADDLTNYNLAETQQYYTQSGYKLQTNVDFVLYDR